MFEMLSAVIACGLNWVTGEWRVDNKCFRDPLFNQGRNVVKLLYRKCDIHTHTHRQHTHTQHTHTHTQGKREREMERQTRTRGRSHQRR